MEENPNLVVIQYKVRSPFFRFVLHHRVEVHTQYDLVSGQFFWTDLNSRLDLNQRVGRPHLRIPEKYKTQDQL